MVRLWKRKRKSNQHELRSSESKHWVVELWEGSDPYCYMFSFSMDIMIHLSYILFLLFRAFIPRLFLGIWIGYFAAGGLALV